eukprot:scaffold40214_cov26-Tisochrysis_lutea.AAC.4
MRARSSVRSQASSPRWSPRSWRASPTLRDSRSTRCTPSPLARAHAGVPCLRRCTSASRAHPRVY